MKNVKIKYINKNGFLSSLEFYNLDEAIKVYSSCLNLDDILSVLIFNNGIWESYTSNILNK